MSRQEDRIPVPTNGHRPRLGTDAEDTGGEADDVVDPAIPVESRLGVAINASPAQLAVGFGIITWAVVFLVGRWWRRR
jgi:hypothetical protein